MFATGSVAPQFASQQFRELGLIQQYGAVLVRLMFLTDAALIYSTLFVSAQALGLGWNQRLVTLALLLISVFGIVTSFRHLYRSWRMTRLRYELAEILSLLSITFLIVAAVLALETKWSNEHQYRLLLGLWYVALLAGISASRVLIRLGLRYYRAAGRDHRNAAFFGATDTAGRLAGIFRTHPWMGIDIVGTYDDTPALEHAGLNAGKNLSGSLDDLVHLAERNEISAVYVTLPIDSGQRVKAIVDRLADTTVSIYFCPTLADFDLMNARWDDVFGHPVISLVTSPFDGYKRHIKRLEDLFLCLLILPLLIVPIALLAVAVKLTSPGPVFYSQTRYGLGGRHFKIRKLRTMYTLDTDDSFVQAKKNDDRITPLGAFLRKTSLDELPQFFNVLQGHMSVVGPRPAPIKYNENHRKVIYRYMMRHKIKPGITGLAQVSGCRGETDTLHKTEMRTHYDLQYINNWAIWLDFKIILRTIFLVAGDFGHRR